MSIDNWKPIFRGALRGFFTVTLSSGMVIHQCQTFEKNGKRWFNPPSQSYVSSGVTNYKPTIEFTDKATRELWSDSILQALDLHLGARR